MLDVAHSSLTTATDDTRENSRHNTGTLSGDFRTLFLQGTAREQEQTRCRRGKTEHTTEAPL